MFGIVYLSFQLPFIIAIYRHFFTSSNKFEQISTNKINSCQKKHKILFLMSTKYLRQQRKCKHHKYYPSMRSPVGPCERSRDLRFLKVIFAKYYPLGMLDVICCTDIPRNVECRKNSTIFF